MEAAGENHRHHDQGYGREDQRSLPCPLEPPTQEESEQDNQPDLEDRENVAVEALVPVADRATVDPVRHWPELAAGVLVMGYEIRYSVKQAGARESARQDAAAPKGSKEKRAPDQEAMIYRENRLPRVRKV